MLEKSNKMTEKSNRVYSKNRYLSINLIKIQKRVKKLILKKALQHLWIA